MVATPMALAEILILADYFYDDSFGFKTQFMHTGKDWNVYWMVNLIYSYSFSFATKDWSKIYITADSAPTHEQESNILELY